MEVSTADSAVVDDVTHDGCRKWCSDDANSRPADQQPGVLFEAFQHEQGVSCGCFNYGYSNANKFKNWARTSSRIVSQADCFVCITQYAGDFFTRRWRGASSSAVAPAYGFNSHGSDAHAHA